jgi:acyl carrier protein
MTTMQTLADIFRMVFDDDTIQIAPEMTSNDIEGWDSLSHLNLIIAVEAKFNIRFSENELLALKTVGTLCQIIEAKLSGN